MKGFVALLDKLASTPDTKESLDHFAKGQSIHYPPVRKQFNVGIGGITEVLSYIGDHDRKSCLEKALTVKQKMSSVYDALDNLNRTEMMHFDVKVRWHVENISVLIGNNLNGISNTGARDRQTRN